jgi:hypothetical protein
MKKILYSLFAVLTMSLALVSCGDDDKGSSKHATLPEEAFAGIYSGTWTTYNADGTTVEKEGETGTITVKKNGEVNYSSKLDIVNNDNSAVNINDVVVNVVWNGDNAKFFTTSTTLPVNGEITADGLLIAKFSKTVKVGKKSTTNFYYFSGKKALLNE